MSSLVVGSGDLVLLVDGQKPQRIQSGRWVVEGGRLQVFDGNGKLLLHTEAAAAPVNKQRMLKHFEGLKDGNCRVASGMDMEQRKIPASEMVLSLASPLLAAMFEQEMTTDNVTIVIPDFDHKTVYSAIRFCHTMMLADGDDTTSLLKFASRYEMAELRAVCSDRLKAQHLLTMTSSDHPIATTAQQSSSSQPIEEVVVVKEKHLKAHPEAKLAVQHFCQPYHRLSQLSEIFNDGNDNKDDVIEGRIPFMKGSLNRQITDHARLQTLPTNATALTSEQQRQTALEDDEIAEASAIAAIDHRMPVAVAQEVPLLPVAVAIHPSVLQVMQMLANTTRDMAADGQANVKRLTEAFQILIGTAGRH